MTMEVVQLFFPLSTEYIKFLNDPDAHGMNYDQWKEKKLRQEMEKFNTSIGKKSHFNSKYNY